MKLVVFHLLLSAPVGFVDGLLHGLGDRVGIHDHQTVDVAGGPAGGLGQGAAAAQEPFLVRVEDGYERNCRDVEAFAQQVDPDQHVEQAVLEVLDDLHAFGRVDVGVDVAAADAGPGEIAVELLGHALGQRGDQDALVALGPYADFLHQVVDLVLGRADLNGRVQQAGRADNLLDDKAFRFFELIVGRCGGDVDALAGDGLEFVESEGTVIGRGGQAEAVFDQGLLAGVVPAEHGADLRQGDVGLVDDGDEIVGEVVDQGEGTLAGFAAVEIAGVVFHAGAVAHFLDHLDVVFDPLLESLGLQALADGLEVFHLFDEVVLDGADGPEALLLGRDEVLGGVEEDFLELLEPGAGNGVD